MRAQTRPSFKEAKLFDLEASSKILDLSYRCGEVNILEIMDEDLQIHKFRVDNNDKVIDKETVPLGPNNTLKQLASKSLLMKDFRANERAVTTCK